MAKTSKKGPTPRRRPVELSKASTATARSPRKSFRPAILDAGIPYRMVAGLIDLVVGVVLLFVFTGIYLVIASLTGNNNVAQISYAWEMIPVLGAVFGYPLLSQLWLRATVGQARMGLEVWTLDHPANNQRIAARCVLHSIFILCMFWPLDYMAILFTRGNRSLHDMVAGTWIRAPGVNESPIYWPTFTRYNRPSEKA